MSDLFIALPLILSGLGLMITVCVIGAFYVRLRTVAEESKKQTALLQNLVDAQAGKSFQPPPLKSAFSSKDLI